MDDHELYQAILDATKTAKPVVLATIVKDSGSVPRHTGTKMLIFGDGSIIGTVGGGEMESRVITIAQTLIHEGRPPRILSFAFTDPDRGDPGVCGGQVELFVEPIMPNPTILIIGAGHCGQALAELADWLGYYVIVTDDRTELCNADVIPHADEHIVTPPATIANAVTIHQTTYIAAVTRGVPLDVDMLPALLKTPAAYIGVMGSQRRWAAARARLIEKGVPEADLARINAPIGLELNAETPRQIAISIMAEIIAVQRAGSGLPMSIE